ncbi:MAG: type IX secretion system membrane protein PorP/SprF [Bacteroidales bacterium]|nr:type IX secretion system membrane protein PorP/SprF [Bacteroidales bacterium]
MRKAIFYIWVVLTLNWSGNLLAQQLPLYSQYVLNGFMVNPSMAGYDGYTSFNTTARQQWLGFSQAPRTYSASWQTRMLKRSYRVINREVKSNNKLRQSTQGRVGLGAYLINDVNANVARTGASFTYAYHIFMNNQQLSFGLAAKAFQYRINSERLTFGEDGDPVLDGDFRTVAYSPDADFGVFFQDPNYFIGVSISNLLQTSVRVGGSEIADFRTYRHYWIMGGYRFRLSDNFDLEPLTLLKSTENWNPQGDFTVKLYYTNLLWGGVSYRTNKSVILLLGVRVDNLYFGYSFDWAFSEIGHFNYGSHEIILSVKLGDNARRYKWLNRY